MSLLSQFRIWYQSKRRQRDGDGRYRTLIHSMNDLVMVIDRDGAYVEVAPTRHRDRVTIANTVAGKRLSDFFSPAQTNHFLQIIRRVLNTGAVEQVEYSYQFGQHQHWYAAVISALPDHPTQILCSVRDITERKLSEEQRVLHSAALNACANGVLITDRHGCIEWVNPAFSAITGYSINEAIGKHPRDLVNSGQQGPAIYSQLWATILSGKVWSGELVNRRKDGSFYIDEQTITPVRNELGEISHFISVKQDISNRRQTEQKLRLESAALDAAANSIVITDRSSVIQWVNPAFTALTGYALNEAHGKTPGGLLRSGKQTSEFYQQLWATLLGGMPWRGELVNKRKDGSLFTEEKYITPVLGEDGEISHFISIGQDITARKQLTMSSENDRILLELIARGEPLPKILEQLVLGYEQLLPGMLGSVLLLDADGRHLRHGAAPNLPAAFCAEIDGVEIGPNVGSCGSAADTGQPVIVADIANDPLWQDYRQLALSHGLQACWSMPICSSSRQVLGTFAFYFSSPRTASAADMAEFSHAADLASLAIERQRALDFLALSEQRFALAVAASNTGIWDWDLESSRVYLSPVWKYLLGYADDELRNEFSEWATRLHPDDEQAFYAALNTDTISATAAIQLEHRLRHKDGSWHWFRMRATALRDGAGQVQRIIGAHEDITESRQIAEVQNFLSQHAAATGGEDFLHALTRFLVTTLDFDYLSIDRLLDDGLNARTETFFHAGAFMDNIDYPLLGAPCGDLAHSDFCYFAQDVCKLYPDDQALRELKAESYIGITLKDSLGQTIGLITGFGPRPIREPKPAELVLRLVAVRAAAELERRLANEDLTRSETRFHTLYDVSGDSIFILDTKGFLDCNQAALDAFGCQLKSQLIGLHPSHVSPPTQVDGSDSRALADAHIATALATGRERFEWLHQRLDNGQTFPADVLLTAMTLDGQRVLQGVVRDISERQHAEQQLQRTLADLDARNRELQDFAFVASHDLQEPLRKIRTFADRLLTLPDQNLSSKAREYLERSGLAAERMQALIDDLLAYSRVGSAQTLPAPVALGSLLKGVIEDLSASIDASSAQIDVGPLPTIEGDASQLRQLLQNLLSNAIKFQPPGQQPRIQISATKIRHRGDMSWWQLLVQDNGIGFAAEYAESIFAPFKRLHSREQYTGTGIGLAIVRRIVERHHGEIRASSEPGFGTTFTIVLPERQIPPPRDQLAHPESPVSQQADGSQRSDFGGQGAKK